MLENLIDGLARGSCYALLAVGFSLVFGILRRINLAYGASVMLGVYVAIWLERRYRFDVLWLVPLVVAVTVAAGLYVERLCLAPHARRAPVTAMAASFAVWMQLQEVATLLLPRHSYMFPELLPLPPLELGQALLRPEQLLALACALAAAAALSWLLYRTRFGLAVRAMTENRTGAACIGINIARISTLIFMLASALGGIAGCLIVGIDGQVTPMFAMWVTLKGMIAAMLGGLDSLGGAIVGGLVLGMAEAFSQSLIGPQYRDVCSYVLLLAVLVACPAGLSALWRGAGTSTLAPVGQ